MTIYQIVSLVTFGPLGLILLGHFVQAVIAKNKEFNIIQAFILFLCITGILVTFFGIN